MLSIYYIYPVTNTMSLKTEHQENEHIKNILKKTIRKIYKVYIENEMKARSIILHVLSLVSLF